MTLREIRAAHPDLFHPNQDWFVNEPFASSDVAVFAHNRVPSRAAIASPDDTPLPLAATLAAAYVMNPKADVWKDYLWTADVDSYGQRVYVGGTANGKGFEIHRHIHITERFGIPVWD